MKNWVNYEKSIICISCRLGYKFKKFEDSENLSKMAKELGISE